MSVTKKHDASDIVERLRKQSVGDYNALWWDEAADEIERLREMCDVLRAIAEQRTSERDEARRMFCDQSFGNKHAVACELGWSCYPEPAHAT
jgi:hypothetical protein